VKAGGTYCDHWALEDAFALLLHCRALGVPWQRFAASACPLRPHAVSIVGTAVKRPNSDGYKINTVHLLFVPSHVVTAVPLRQLARFHLNALTRDLQCVVRVPWFPWPDNI
jgi:hypothetical protein